MQPTPTYESEEERRARLQEMSYRVNQSSFRDRQHAQAAYLSQRSRVMHSDEEKGYVMHDMGIQVQEATTRTPINPLVADLPPDPDAHLSAAERQAVVSLLDIQFDCKLLTLESRIASCSGNWIDHSSLG